MAVISWGRMKRLYRFSIRLMIVVVGLWVAGFLNFTRPWILPESIADGVCSGNPVGVYRLLLSGEDVNARSVGEIYDEIAIFYYFDYMICKKPMADPLLSIVLFHFSDVDFHATISSGLTLLILTAGQGDREEVQFLLEKGLDPNRQTNTGETALTAAVRTADAVLIENLLRHGANPNLQNQKGETALMMAAGRGFTNAAKVLLQHGADPSLKDKRDQTAADHARAEWRREVMAVLENLPAQN